MTKLIEAMDVVKFYGGKMILKKIGLSVEGPGIFGLLGPNGAGKTTFIKCLLNLAEFTSGKILINGIPANEERSRDDMVYLPEKFSFFPYYTVQGTLQFFGKMYGLKGQELEERVGLSMKKLSISSIATQKIRTLSKGQLQRVGLAKILVSDANLIILDEPFTGLDPIGIKDLKDLLLEIKAQGKTVFLNSHILSEVEQICDEVAIVREGEILVQKKLKSIQQTGRLEEFFYNIIKGTPT